MPKSQFKILKIFFLFFMCILSVNMISSVVFAKERVIKVGQYDYPGLIDKNADGSYSGYAVEYLNEMSDYTGWKYEFVYDSWENLLDKLEKGEIDLLCSAQYTEERTNKFDYAKSPLGYENSIVYVRAEDDRYYFDDYEAFDGMTVGAMKGNYQNGIFDEYAKEKGFTYKFKFYDLDNQAFTALDNKEVDAVLTGGMSMRAEYKTVCEFSSDAFYMIVKKGNTDLMDTIDLTMERIRIKKPYYLEELYQKYYGDNYKNTPPSFTREEAEYIKNAGVIKVGNQVGRFPLCDLDEEGKLYGIQIDLMNKVSEISGLKFKYEAVEAGVKAVDYMEDSGAKIFNGMAVSSITKVSPKIEMSEPMLSSNIGIVGKRGKLLSKESMITFVLPKNFVNGKESLIGNFPNAKFIYCDTGEDCLKAIVKGKADYTIQDKYICSALLQKPYYESLTLMDAYQIPQNVCMAVLKEDQVLLSILNKCVNRIGENTMVDVVAGYTVGSPYQMNFKDYLYKYRIPAMVIVLLIAALLSATFIFLGMKGKNAARIASSNKKLEILNERLAQSNKKYEEANKELAKAVEKADSANAAKTEFFSRMSHDMRTPMNGILGLADLSRDETDVDILKNNFVKVHESGQYLLGLINDTLDFQKIENGRMLLEPQVTSTKELIAGAADMIRLTAAEKNILFTIVNKNANLEGYVLVDPMRMKQVFVNLLSNAVKFTPPGGTVELGFEVTKREGNMVHDIITVTDTGIGMSEEFLQKGIFNPFSQEYNDVTSSYAGTGLGLSIAKKLLEMMGATIEVESELGVGTKFTIHIDFECVEEEEASKTTVDNKRHISEIMESLAGKNILLAEDHPLNAEISTKLLEKAGCKVTWAKHGKECVEVFSSSSFKQFDAIVMDVRMPVMSGLEATEAIRNLDREDAKKVPIIAMTANAYAEDVQKCMEAGMNAHLAKPINPEQLYVTLAEYV